MQTVQGGEQECVCLAEKAALDAQKEEQAAQWLVAQGKVRNAGPGEPVSF